MEPRSPRQIWETALGELQIEVNKANFRTWLGGTVGLGDEGDDFIIGVPNTFVAEFLDRNLRSLIERVLAKLTRREVTARFNVVGREAAPVVPKAPLPLFNPRYTFDSFVVGDSNRLAHAAALKVAEEPGRQYNPLFLHGRAGLGKTHLLHAIGHKAAADGLEVACVSAEQFTNEMVAAIRDGQTDAFRKKYRHADMLLVDDVQFFSDKERTKENFFHTFNALHSANHQIAMTCDSPPGAIPRLPERMRSRFEWGLVADLQPPDFETRINILRAKAEREETPIGNDVLEFIALQIKENIRQLEGSLNRVVAYSKLIKEMLTPETAARALQNLSHDKPTPTPPTPVLIVEAVAASFQVSLSDLRSRKRDEATVLARQVSMYLIRQETACSLAQIGRQLGDRSPATISYACDKIADNIKNDPHLRRQVFNVRQTLNAATPTE